MIHELHLQTRKHNEMIDITAQVEKLLAQGNIQEGLVFVYCPHITAGITINENANLDEQRDLLRRLDEIPPWNMTEDRHIEGNSAVYLKTSTVGASQPVIIHKSKLLLGCGQGIYFCEFDGPRSRTCYVKIIV